MSARAPSRSTSTRRRAVTGLDLMRERRRASHATAHLIQRTHEAATRDADERTPDDPRAAQAALERERADCLASFERFVCAMHPEWGELPDFHRRLCAKIDRWYRDESAKNLLIVMPPGHAKSSYTRLAVAWIFAHDPDARAAYTSYGQDLAEEHSVEVQALMTSDAYMRLFPATRLKVGSGGRRSDNAKRGAQRRVDRFDVVGMRGKFRAVGMGGPLTGIRIDLGVIDDPVKDPKTAASATEREDQWRWYTRVLCTRKRPKRKLRLLMLLTRWHLDDLAGRVLEREPDEWELVHLPALKVGGPTSDDPREDGEALWPDMISADQLIRARTRDPEGFASLQQGWPVAEGGNLFREAWMRRRWSVLPDVPGDYLQSWDLRNDGKGVRTSYAVGGLWFVPHGSADTYLVDLVRGRWSPDETIRVLTRINVAPTTADPCITPLDWEMEARRELWAQAGMKAIEEKADGIAALSILRRVIPGLHAVRPVTDKLTRARGTLAFWAAGNIILPAWAPWLADYVGEHVTFPASPNDDQVDMTSQALDLRYRVTLTAPVKVPRWDARAGKAHKP